MAGAGIRLAGAYDLFQTVVAKLGIPVLAAWDAIDAIPSDHPCCLGRPGTYGQRGANFILQNSDLLLSVGCRLSTRQTGYAFSAFARAAYKIVVDIDPAELRKPTIHPDLSVLCDAKAFLQALNRRLPNVMPAGREWLDWCNSRNCAIPGGLARVPPSGRPRQPLRVLRRALRLSGRGRRCGQRQRDGLHRRKPGVVPHPPAATHR